MLRCVTASLVLVSLGHAFAGTIDVPADHSTIGQAIAAAATGDTIRIHAGTYFENLTITGKSLKLVGLGAVIIDGLSGGQPHDSTLWLKSGADGSVVRNLTLRHARTSMTGGYGVYVEAENVVLEKLRIVACEAGGIRADNDKCVIRKCVIEGCGNGIEGGSDYVRVEKNVVRNVFGTGIRMSGKAPLVAKNLVENVEFGLGIDAGASSTRLLGNVVRNVSDQVSIRLNGGGCEAIGNRVEFGSDDDYAFYVAGSSCVLVGNTIRDYTSVGISVQATAMGSELRKNRLDRTGTETEIAIEILAENVTLTGNRVGACDGAGIAIQAEGANVTGNVVKASMRDGIRLAAGFGGVVLVGNKISACLGEGIDLRSQPASFEKNVVQGNRTDVATTFLPSFSSTNKIGSVGTSDLD